MMSKGAISGVIWTPEEWSKLAGAFARDELAAPDMDPWLRWEKLMPLVFEPERRRPVPRGRFEDKAARLVALLPAAREEARKPAAAVEEPPREKVRRIFWKHHERVNFARVYVMLEASHPSLTIVERMAKAQDELIAMGDLTEDRRKACYPNAIHSPDLAPLIELERTNATEALKSKLIREELARLEAKEQAAALATSAPAEAPTPAPIQEAAAPAAPVIQAAAPLPAGLSAMQLLKMTIDAFVAEALVSPAAQSVIQDTVSRMLGARSLPVTAAAPKPVEPEEEAEDDSPQPASHESKLHTTFTLPTPVQAPGVTIKRRKILIVGLLGSQVEQIKYEFGNVFDLRFADGDGPGKQYEQLAKNVDTVVAIERFTGKTVRSKLKGCDDFRLCAGVVGDLKRILHGIHAGDTHQAQHIPPKVNGSHIHAHH
jgi:hypothetical protein